MTATRKKAAARKMTTPDKATVNTLTIKQEEGKSDALLMAEIGLSALAVNANTARIFAQGSFGAIGLDQSIDVFRRKAANVQSGDMSDVEATLTAQAATLDAMFNELSRRAALNMGQHLPATEAYLRQAFKAQAQCRSTLEALAEIKNPRPVAFVKQANIAHGPQQVNNGTVPHARGEKEIVTNELSRESHELLPDTRTQAVAGRVNQEVEAMGAIHRATD